jgi:hypothetical protein
MPPQSYAGSSPRGASFDDLVEGARADGWTARPSGLAVFRSFGTDDPGRFDAKGAAN